MICFCLHLFVYFLIFTEKDLREAAHAEVAQTAHEEGDKSFRKRNLLDADEKAKQKYAVLI